MSKDFQKKMRENPDSFDDFDFRPEVKESDAYMAAVLPDHIKARLEQKAAKAKERAPA